MLSDLRRVLGVEGVVRARLVERVAVDDPEVAFFLMILFQAVPGAVADRSPDPRFLDGPVRDFDGLPVGRKVQTVGELAFLARLRASIVACRLRLVIVIVSIYKEIST